MAQNTFSLKYRETPYQVTATRKFYHPQTKSVNINPTTPNPSLAFELVRKTGTWIYTEGSDSIPYGQVIVEDPNLDPADSHVDTPGVNGLIVFSEDQEWIDGEWTGEIRNVTETITPPVNEIYIQGTAVVTYKIDVARTESIPYTTEEYNSSAYYVDERVVTQQGVNGVRSFYRSQKYVNGVATGIFTGTEFPEVTTQPITHRIAVGTKLREVTVTVYLKSTVASSHTVINLLPVSGAVLGKEIIHIKLEEGVQATGSWTIDASDPQTSKINLGGQVIQFFGNLPRLYYANESIQLTYKP